jgi:hypothetical protein
MTCKASNLSISCVRTLLLFAVSLATFGAASLTPDTLKLATGWEVLNHTPDGGSARVDGRELSYEILGAMEVSVNGREWSASVVRFPTEEMDSEALEMVLSLGECGCAHPPIIVVASGDGKEAYAATIDEAIVASAKVLAFEQGDFMGSGSELSLTLATNYCDKSKMQLVMAERRFVYSLPKLDPLASLDGHLIVRTPDAIVQARNRISVSKSADGKPALVYHQSGVSAPQVLTFTSPADKRLKRLDPTVALAGAPQPEDESPSTFRGRLLDEKGEPLPGIEVQYASQRTGLLATFGLLDTGTVTTDGDGLFEAPTGNGLELGIKAEGYYELRERFHPAKYNAMLKGMNSKQVTDAITDLVLERELAEVPVWDTLGNVRKEVPNPPERVAVGLKFYPTRKENENGFLEDTILADIVFEARRLCDPSSPEAQADECEWEVVVRGQHGWELVPGESNSGRAAIRKAVATGYKQRWVFTSTSLPYEFYLRKDGGERYGLLDMVGVRKSKADPKTRSENELIFSTGYVVQAEPVGSTSLVHKRKPGAYFSKPKTLPQQPK